MMIIPAIRSILPVLLKSARFTPATNEVAVLSRLINRMKYLRSPSSSIRETAQKAIEEFRQPHQAVNTIVELFKNKWGWNKEKLIDVLDALWKELK